MTIRTLSATALVLLVGLAACAESTGVMPSAGSSGLTQPPQRQGQSGGCVPSNDPVGRAEPAPR